MPETNKIGSVGTQEFMTPEERAPGWKIRCLKCGFTDDYGKYGIRQKAFGKSYTFGRCPKCRRFRFAIIEKVKA